MTLQRNLNELWSIARNNYRMFGAWETALSAIVYVIKDELSPSDSFDKRHGVSTDGDVRAVDNGVTDLTVLADAIGYVPVREQVVATMLRELLRDRDAKGLAFVDLGCGKGRALVVASRYPFREILGVEIAPVLAERARDNIRDYLRRPNPPNPIRCQTAEVVCDSASQCDFPRSDLIVYMYRPFVGAVFGAVLDRLAEFRRTTGHRVTIALCCPNEEPLLVEHSAFEKVYEYRVINSEYSWVAYEAVPGAFEA